VDRNYSLRLALIIKDKDIRDLGQFIINELAKELIKQDHKATGKLISSLDYTINDALLGKELIITMNDYGKYVNTGRKRGAAKVPIKALVEWIKQKGIETNNKKVLGMAFAIQKTIEKEGSPTRNSRAKGKRTEFVDDTLIRISAEINRRISDAVFKEFELTVDNFVRRI
jgi:hypothetical protein